MPPGRLLGTSKLAKNNIALIPKAVRDFLDLKPGDEVVFVEEGGRVVLLKGPVEVKV